MDESINNLSGGPAAQTPNTNPNPETSEPCISTTPSGSAAPTNINPSSEIMTTSTSSPPGDTPAPTPNPSYNQETKESSSSTTPSGNRALTPNPNPNPEIMETPISPPPGGIATQAPNINPSTQTMENHERNDIPLTVKEVAAMFQCAASSLKNNIKANKLVATKAAATAPFMVRPSVAERLLRETPGIASVFHPGNSVGADPKQPDAITQSAPVAIRVSPPPAQPMVVHMKASEASPVTRAVKVAIQDKPVQVQQPVAQAATPPDEDGGPETRATKKRRHRRRGKGGGLGQSVPAAAVRPPFLKALDGTTPAERLRIMACLNELAGLVALA